MKNRTVVLLISSFMAAACGANPPPVSVEGNRESLASLAGEWAGSYVGFDSGRSGSIIFVLEADGESAAGDVLMIPRRLYRQMDDDEPDGVQSEPSWPEPIRIRFVHAEAEGLYGQLAAYRDPECGCRLETTFRGRIMGDRIEGTFETRHVEGGKLQTGTWHVVRSEP